MFIHFILIVDVKVWWGMSVALAALISWSLQSRPDLIMKLENSDVLANVMKTLEFVCAQNLSQVYMYF